MQKINKLLAFGFLVLLISTVSAASYWIYSNVVPITVSAYSFSALKVDDPTPVQYQNITFSGTLYYDGSPAINQNVTLFRNSTIVAWGLTNSSGIFLITYNCTDVGTFDFKAGYEVQS